jgi:5-methyltetrahydropteroyltriglutamate--homocysteine methyltransferase
MDTSKDRILTTLVGSLPRPAALADLLERQDRGEEVASHDLSQTVKQAVLGAVQSQTQAGIDVVSDGEMSKMSYHIYTKHRLSGLTNRSGKGVAGRPLPSDLKEFPEYQIKGQGGLATSRLQSVICTGELAYVDYVPLDADIANLKAAVTRCKPMDAFMNSASPGVLANYIPNEFYPDTDAYRQALADAMRPEYEAIHKAGLVLQIDCPDIAGSRHTDQQDMTDKQFLAYAEQSIEALNDATRNIPANAMRLHICWLNYPGPHTHDFPVAKLIPLLNKARPQALLFEGANPRHAHEWQDWRAAEIADDKILVPGVIDSTSNFVEHPKLIAQRICRYADIVGRERLIAGSDCGFGTYAGPPQVYASVVRAKMAALAQGAQLATEKLW